MSTTRPSGNSTRIRLRPDLGQRLQQWAPKPIPLLKIGRGDAGDFDLGETHRDLPSGSTEEVTSLMERRTSRSN